MSPISSWPKSACTCLSAFLQTTREEPRTFSVRGPRVLRLLHQRAATVGKRTERLVRWNRCADLVIVPRRLRFRRLLHFDEIRRMNLAAVDTYRAFAEQRIVGRQLL